MIRSTIDVNHSLLWFASSLRKRPNEAILKRSLEKKNYLLYITIYYKYIVYFALFDGF